MVENLKNEWDQKGNQQTNDPETLVLNFYKKLYKAYNDNTGDGWKPTPENLEKALQAMNEVIDNEGKACYLNQNRRQQLKDDIAKIKDWVLPDNAGEAQISEPRHMIVESFKTMCQNLNQKNIVAGSIQSAYDIISGKEVFPVNTGGMIVPMSQFVDHVREVQDNALKPKAPNLNTIDNN